MKHLFKLSVLCAVVLFVSAGLGSAAGQASSAADNPAAAAIFAPASPQPLDFLQLAGPADGCCTRHATICEGICSCGIEAFICGDNSTGGCSSSCKCTKCI